MMQWTTLSSPSQPYYVVVRPINNEFDVTLLIWDKWDQLGTHWRCPNKLCLQRTFMMQLTTISSQPQQYYVVLTPIKDKFDVNLLILDKWDKLGTNKDAQISYAFKEPSWCSWRPFPADHNHNIWFWDLSKTKPMSLCPFKTSETGWTKIVDAQKYYAFKEPSWCSWRPFPAHLKHIMWFQGLS